MKRPSMSTRFAVAVHTLAFLNDARGEAVRSDTIAESVNTNPVVIRRLLACLARCGLVSTQLGTGGGARLAKSADDITLLEVHEAVEVGPLFETPRASPNSECHIGANILPVLDRFTSRAERALQAELAKVTVAQVSRSIQNRVRRYTPRQRVP